MKIDPSDLVSVGEDDERFKGICAPAALHVRFEGPSFIAGTLDIELVLFTALAALQVFGAEALDLARLVVGAQLHSQRARAKNALSRGHRTVMTAPAIVQRTQIAELLIGAVRTVVFSITEFLSGQTNTGVIGTHVMGEFTHQRLAVILIGVIFTVTVTVTHPSLTDAPRRVPAAKLHCWITHVRYTLAVLFIAQIHAVGVSITPPALGNTQPVHATLELICVTSTRRTGCLVGAVSVGLVAVVSAVVVSIAGPVIGNTSTAVTLELSAGARVAAAGFITVITTVIVVIAAPVDVDAAAVVAGELSDRETGRVRA